MPGVEQEQDIRELIGTTGMLEFMPVPKGRRSLPARSWGRRCPHAGEPDSIATSARSSPAIEIDSRERGQDGTTGELVVDFSSRSTGATLFDEFAHALPH